MRPLSRPLGVVRIRWGICRRGWGDHRVHHPHERRLAAARGAQEDGRGTLLDGEGEVLDGACAARVGLGDVIEANHARPLAASAMSVRLRVSSSRWAVESGAKMRSCSLSTITQASSRCVRPRSVTVRMVARRSCSHGVRCSSPSR